MITDSTPFSCVIICRCGRRVAAESRDVALRLMAMHEDQRDGECGTSARDSLRRRRKVMA